MAKPVPKELKVFISYAHEDDEVAVKIDETLKSHGYSSWLYQHREKNPPGGRLVKKINEALNNADYILALFSIASLNSYWCISEVEAAFIRRNDERRDLLIPIRLENVEIPLIYRPILSIDIFPDQTKGLKEITSFLKHESSPISLEPVERRGSTPLPLQEASLREIRLTTLKCVSEDDFAYFLKTRNIHPDEIGNSFNERLAYFLHFTQEESKLKQFLVWLNRKCKGCIEDQLELIQQNEIAN